MLESEIVHRKSCVICGNENLTPLTEVNKVPIFMGVVQIYEEPIFHDLKYGVCSNCATLQLSELIPLQTLYRSNHNTEVVGSTWSLHNDAFGRFINRTSKHEDILEVGAPDTRFLPYFKWNSWTLIEPNPTAKIPPEVKTIKDWLKPGLDISNKVDTVVLSHVFEHFYDPFEALKVLSEYVVDGGKVIISIPDFETITREYLMPPGGLHFEHTFNLNLHNFPLLIERAGFQVKEVEYFKNHSIFISIEKQPIKSSTELDRIKKANLKMNDDFMTTLTKYRTLAEDLQHRSKSWPSPAYIFGAHFPAQFLFALGVDPYNFNCVLDNSRAKVGQVLYGTNLMVLFPQELERDTKPLVIVQMGPYTQEISEQLTKVNFSTVVS